MVRPVFLYRRAVGIFTSGDAVALTAGESGPRSAAQMIFCLEILKKLSFRLVLNSGAGHGVILASLFSLFGVRRQ